MDGAPVLIGAGPSDCGLVLVWGTFPYMLLHVDVCWVLAATRVLLGTW